MPDRHATTTPYGNELAGPALNQGPAVIQDAARTGDTLLPRAMRASKLAVRANRACQCCNRPPHFVQVLVAVSFRGASSQSLSTCAGAISKLHEASSCGDDNDDDILSNPRTAETCASDACAAFIASMTDDAMQEMVTGVATCTGPFAVYQAHTSGDYDGYLTHVVRATAIDCGLPSTLSPPVLSTCAGAISKLHEAEACGNDENDDDQSNPRTPEKCASAACAAFIASMTDGALQDMASGFATCTGDQAEHQAKAAQADWYADQLRKTASDCNLPSALSPGSGRRRMALKAVEPIGVSTFWKNAGHPLRKKYRTRPTTLAAVKPSRRTTVARRLISTEGSRPICANGWVWPPSPPPPSPPLSPPPSPPPPASPPPPPSPPPLPVVTAFIHAEGDVADYTGEKLAEMEQKVADEVGVGVAAVSITVSAGSVILKVPRGMPQETLT